MSPEESAKIGNIYVTNLNKEFESRGHYALTRREELIVLFIAGALHEAIEIVRKEKR